MKTNKLDAIDKRILKKLQENGRTSNVELAKIAGISAPPCLRRVNILEQNGYIDGYHADINQLALGFEVTVYAHVTLSSVSPQARNAFKEKIIYYPEIRECYLMTGESDFLLKIITKDWEAYQDFVSMKLMALEYVTHVNSSLTLKCLKKEAGIPLELLDNLKETYTS